jgi:hypothetical protein
LVNSPNNISSAPDFSHNTTSADIDNDGDLDIYVCNIYNETQVGPYFLINNGSGTFTKLNTNFPTAIANLNSVYMASRFADIDNDNDKDLILGALDGSGIAKDLILLNNGSGVFTPGSALPNRYGSASWGTVGIVAKDFNNDGWVDLLMSTLVGYQTCQIQLLLNNQNGTFTDATANIPQNWPSSNTWIKWIEVGDFNSDGFIDIVCSLHFGSVPKLYFNNGNGIFEDASNRISLPNSNGIVSIRVANYDEDAAAEIAFLCANNKIIIAKKIQNYVLNTNDFTSNQIEDIVVYPNPFSSNFSIKIPENEEFKLLTIFDSGGKKIYSTSTFEENWSIDHLSRGVYILNIETDKHKYSKKTIKK